MMNFYQLVDLLLMGQSLPQDEVTAGLAVLLADILAQYGLVLVCKNGVIFARAETLN